MDDIDKKILTYLRKNARMKNSEIASEVHLSVTSVIERIRKMEKSGVIKQYTTVVAPDIGGSDITAFTYVVLENPKYNEDFARLMRENAEIAECHYITGDYDFFLKIETSGSSSLMNVLNFIKCAPGVSLTRTNVVLATLKNNFAVVPDKRFEPAESNQNINMTKEIDR